MVVEGQLAKGLGRAAAFTQLDWVRSRLIELVGIDPFPGTLNLTLGDDMNLARWRQWRGMPGQALEPADAAFCRARCYPVQVAGRVPAAVLLPEVTDYPEDKIELVAALPIRQYLSLGAAARLKVELCRPLPVRAVLFDLDGTLVDSVGAYIEVARVATAPFGLEVTEEQVRMALAMGGSFWKGAVPQWMRVLISLTPGARTFTPVPRRSGGLEPFSPMIRSGSELVISRPQNQEYAPPMSRTLTFLVGWLARLPSIMTRSFW